MGGAAPQRPRTMFTLMLSPAFPHPQTRNVSVVPECPARYFCKNMPDDRLISSCFEPCSVVDVQKMSYVVIVPWLRPRVPARRSMTTQSRATLADVARLAGVSSKTVSRVFANAGKDLTIVFWQQVAHYRVIRKAVAALGK